MLRTPCNPALLLALSLTLGACSGGEEEPNGLANDASDSEQMGGETGAPEVMDPAGSESSEQTGTGGGEGMGASGNSTGGRDGSEVGSGGLDGGGDPEGGTGGSADELELVGDAPARQDFPATNEFWQRLADSDEFTNFGGSSPFSIAPLREENFPPNYDFCSAEGGDAELNGEQQWARAELKASLKTWYYDITLVAVPEEDGHTPYQLLLDGEVVREFTSPETGTGGAEDLEDFEHVWTRVPIEADQSVEIRAKANSNLEIPEAPGCRTGSGFASSWAWARGRFNGLVLRPSAIE